MKIVRRLSSPGFAAFLLAACAGCGPEEILSRPLLRGAVPDGLVVLFRAGPACGALRLSDQEEGRGASGSFAYEWVYRADGRGRLDPADPSVSTGKGRGVVRAGVQAFPLAFGSFQLEWAPARDGYGSLRYRPGPLGPGAGAFGVCLTTESSFRNLDALDSAWSYSRPSVLETGRFGPAGEFALFYGAKVLAQLPLLLIAAGAWIAARKARGWAARLQLVGAFVAAALVVADWVFWAPYVGLLGPRGRVWTESWAVTVLVLGGLALYSFALGYLGSSIRAARRPAEPVSPP